MNLEKLKPSAAGTIVFSMGSLCVILTIIFLNNRALFSTMDIFKILILGVGIVSPVIGFNTFITSIFIEFSSENINSDSRLASVYSLGSILSLLILSVCLFLRIFINLSYINILIIFVILEMAVIVLGLLLRKKII